MEGIDIRQKMAAAIMDAIIEASRLDGQVESVIDPTAAIHALTAVIGMLVEADHTIKTPREVREFSEGVGKQVHRQIKVMRESFEATGERAWNGSVFDVH